MRLQTSLQANGLLKTLSAECQAKIAPYLRPEVLTLHQKLYTAGNPINRVYFPTEGIVSLVTRMSNGKQIEIGVVGDEGMVGLPLLFHVSYSRYETFVQYEGAALTISEERFMEMIDDQAIHNHFLRFAYVFAIQGDDTALANAHGKLEARLARWLLMCQDRLHSDDLNITHQFLSIMMGVTRAGVTLTLNEMEKKGFIALDRGQITIIDRDSLVKSANGLYGHAESEYATVFSVGDDEYEKVVALGR